ncbi:MULTISPECIES: DsbA family protein [unclassified Iodidimonas]|jgi:protein-disulfide isomerase|uniref:DsbA family protein n=1 Tax=unclassified Iodidimonas TaxID=2626145 RepID=UPI002482A9AE|nr:MULTISPECIES: DsbA family protein [unclassified Iodidimonas]
MSNKPGASRLRPYSLIIASLALVISMASLLLVLNSTQKSTLGPNPDKARMHDMFRAYLLENPEILPEAIAILRQRDEAAQQQRLQALASDRWDDIRKDAYSPIIGPDDAAVTVVEYYDYRCPFCRRAHPDMVRLLKEHGDDIRYVFKQFPVLDRDGENGVSHFAARAAIAASNQEVFPAFHEKLMTHEGSLNKGVILDFAEALKLDMGRFRSDMDDPALSAYFEQTINLARMVGISGTPTYVINGQVLAGAQGYDAILDLVEKARN